MKNLKSLFSVVLIAFALVIVTSCGNESGDPTPAKPLYIGYWVFQSAVVVPNGNGSSYTVSSLSCANIAPAFKVEYEILTETTATQKSTCFPDAPLTYTTTFSSGALTSVTFNDSGSTIYFDKIVINESAKTLTANQQTFGSAKTITVTFKLK